MDNPHKNSFPRHAHHSSSVSESASASSVASAQSLIQPPSSFYSAGGPPPPPRNLPEPSQQASGAGRSPASFGPPEYAYRPYSAASGSPSSAAGSSMHDSSIPPADQYGGVSSSHLHGGNLSAQKRAYRQRRKDPSCDACRERKVKCDATETSSCSECSSRNVKCQFTKETNRRMSSIKQVQDLQNQLNDARQEISRLKSAMQSMPTYGESQSATLSLANLPALGPQSQQRQPPPAMNNFDHVRRGIKTYSRGIFKLPPAYRDPMQTPSLTTTELTLPSRTVTNTLLAQYYSHLHRHAPMLHWPSFNQQVDQVYVNGGFQGCSQIWAGVFFGVLACATCQTVDTTREGLNPDVDGMRYLIIAARLLNTWTDNLTIDHARTTFFIATFLTEQNVRSAGWCWLGSAVRMVQDIGLQSDVGPWTPLDAEARRRVCWSIYAMDRLQSLEGRPLSVYEEDFIGSIGWPNHSVDEWMQPQPQDYPMSPQSPYQVQATPTVIIPVIQMVAEMKKTFKSKVIAQDNLKRYDDYFDAIMRTYPEPYQTHSDSYIDALTLTAVVPLQIARFVLYRHNLNVWSQPQERSDAINRMALVARDTVRYIKRTMHTPPSSPARSPFGGPAPRWQELLKSQSSNLLCRHLWRCTLVLCFRGDYEAAMVCVRASSTIGTMRKHNVACGRNLSYFLDKMVELAQHGHCTQYHLEKNEEMMAYLSGDMQGEQDTAWIWTGTERHLASSPSELMNRSGSPPPDIPSTALLTEREMNDWGGWDRVTRLVNELVDLQRREQRGGQGHPYHQPAHNTQKRLHLAPPDTPTSTAPPPGPPSTSGSSTSAGASRISIANII